MFQSTPLCEGRHKLRRYFQPDVYRFNPRPCVRGDSKIPLARSTLSRFQSTPLCEGRLPIILTPASKIAVSIHAPV